MRCSIQIGWFPGLIQKYLDDNNSDDQFDDYTRRQYLAKKPNANPFGDGEQPVRFVDLPVLTKV